MDGLDDIPYVARVPISLFDLEDMPFVEVVDSSLRKATERLFKKINEYMEGRVPLEILERSFGDEWEGAYRLGEASAGDCDLQNLRDEYRKFSVDYERVP